MEQLHPPFTYEEIKQTIAIAEQNYASRQANAHVDPIKCDICLSDKRIDINYALLHLDQLINVEEQFSQLKHIVLLNHWHHHLSPYCPPEKMQLTKFVNKNGAVLRQQFPIDAGSDRQYRWILQQMLLVRKMTVDVLLGEENPLLPTAFKYLDLLKGMTTVVKNRSSRTAATEDIDTVADHLDDDQKEKLRQLGERLHGDTTGNAKEAQGQTAKAPANTKNHSRLN